MDSIDRNGANHIEKMNAFLDRATAQIPGLREKKMVREEMEDHIEEEAADLMESGMNEEAAYVETVSRMGDAGELAHELMLVHPYDSNEGFNRMVLVLWLGLFLAWIPRVNQMPPSVLGWLGMYLAVFALYRMRTVNQKFRRAFYASYTMALFMPLSVLALAQPSAQLDFFLRALSACGSIVCFFVLAYSLEAAVCGELGREWGGVVWFLRVLICTLSGLNFLISAFHGFPRESVSISIDGSLGFLIVIAMLAVVILDFVWIFQTWKIKKALQEESYAGIEPFSFKKTGGYLIPLVCITLLPAAVSIVLSVWPVKGTFIMSLPATDFEQLSGDEATERLLSILPEDEKRELGGFEIISFTKKEDWSVRNGDPDVWVIRGVNQSGQERIAAFSVWENPKTGFKAAGGFWITGRYSVGDEIHHRSFFAYEKDGLLYEFQPVRLWEMDQKTAAEYALRQDADRVYCYQALTALNILDESMHIGYEAAVQHSPLRIPYDDILVQPDSSAGGPVLTGINPTRNQISLLDYGWVREQSNEVWEKSGGIANFVGEGGEREYDQHYNWSWYNDGVSGDDWYSSDSNSSTWMTQSQP